MGRSQRVLNIKPITAGLQKMLLHNHTCQHANTPKIMEGEIVEGCTIHALTPKLQGGWIWKDSPILGGHQGHVWGVPEMLWGMGKADSNTPMLLHSTACIVIIHANSWIFLDKKEEHEGSVPARLLLILKMKKERGCKSAFLLNLLNACTMCIHDFTLGCQGM